LKTICLFKCVDICKGILIIYVVFCVETNNKNETNFIYIVAVKIIKINIFKVLYTKYTTY
jgi:hypothetical protein